MKTQNLFYYEMCYLMMSISYLENLSDYCGLWLFLSGISNSSCSGGFMTRQTEAISTVRQSKGFAVERILPNLFLDMLLCMLLSFNTEIVKNTEVNVKTVD